MSVFEKISLNSQTQLPGKFKSLSLLTFLSLLVLSLMGGFSGQAKADQPLLPSGPGFISLEIDKNTASLQPELDSSDNNYFATKTNAKVITNVQNGYNLTFAIIGSSDNSKLRASSNNNQSFITSTSANIDNPQPLAKNSWGFAIAGKDKFDRSYSQKPSASSKWAKIPLVESSAKLANGYSINKSNQPTPASGITSTIWFGANVSSSLAPDIYRTTINYSLVADLPSPPTIEKVDPNEIFVEHDDKITIRGTDLKSAYRVYIDSNDDGQFQPAEACQNLVINSDKEIACNAAKYSDPSRHRIHVITQGGKASAEFTYLNSNLCQSGNPDNACEVTLDDNLFPVRYAGNNMDGSANWQLVDNDNKENPNKIGYWYDYNNKRWANAVTLKASALVKAHDYMTGKISSYDLKNDDILGFYTYIPRYAYEVKRYSAIDKPSLAENFDIMFEKTKYHSKIPHKTCSAVNFAGLNGQDYRNGCNISRDYYDASSTWSTHPGFSFGDKQLSGYWLGKFETTGTRIEPTIKPNQRANTAEPFGNYYDIAKSIGHADPNNTGGNGNLYISGFKQNSHNLSSYTTRMARNSEWGGAVYLSSSEFGVGVKLPGQPGSGVQPNAALNFGSDADNDSQIGISSQVNYGVTGCGPAARGSLVNYSDGTPLNMFTKESPMACSQDKNHSYNGVIGQLASTTGNPTGVYDMSGGSWDLLAANVTQHDGISTSGDNYMIQQAKWPYVDLYQKSDGFSVSASWSATHQGGDATLFNNDICTYQTCGGMALHETKLVQSVTTDKQSWGDECSRFPTLKDSWFMRGGSARNLGDTGIYAHSFSSGDKSLAAAVRVVMTN